MFGIKSSVLLGGALAVAAAGIGGYYMGYGAGKNAVQVKWDKDTIKRDREEDEYRARLNEALTKIDSTNNLISEEVRTVYNDRVKVITETKYANRDVIREVFRETPFLSKGWVYAHNQLVEGKPIDAVAASDRTASKFTESDSLTVIAENYSVARQAIEKDKGWNTFYARTYDNYRLPSNGGVRTGNGDKAGNKVDTYGPE